MGAEIARWSGNPSRGIPMSTKRQLALGVSALALAVAALAAPASARTIYVPLKHGVHMPVLHQLRHVGPYLPAYHDNDPATKSGTWADIKASLPFTDGPDTALLL